MEKKEWFAEWFDSCYYHILYKNRDDQEAQHFIERLVAYLNLPGQSMVLDLACGKGRHSYQLHSLGLNVTGVDLSPSSIEEARKSEEEGLCFVVGDMRKPLEGRKFDAVFNLFTSFGYFESMQENQCVVNAVREMLLPEGIFVIDFMNATKVIRTLVTDELKTVDGIDFHIERNYDGTHIRKHISFLADGNEHSHTEQVQALQLSDFSTLLRNSGFEILRTFGDFDLNPYDALESDRLIIIAKLTHEC